MNTTAMEQEEDARAAEEAAETGMEQLTISGEKVSQVSSEKTDPPRVSEAGEESGAKVIDDKEEAGMPVDKENDKPAGKPKKRAMPEDQQPPVDLDLYAIYKDESGLYQTEVCKTDRHGNEGGCRCILELYESKSEPKKYLFGAKKYPTAASSACFRRFPSRAPGEKERQLKKFKVNFRNWTQVDWSERDSMPSKGPYYYLSPAVPGKKVGSTSHENKLDELGREEKGNLTGAVAVPHGQRDDDGETSSKRKSGFSEERPAKAFKVTKPSVVGDSAKTTNGGSKTT